MYIGTIHNSDPICRIEETGTRMRPDISIWSIPCQVPIDTPRTAWLTCLIVNAAWKIVRNISLGESERMMLKGDVFIVEGECESLRVSLIIARDSTAQHSSLKVLHKSRHPPHAREDKRIQREKTLGTGDPLNQQSPSLSFWVCIPNQIPTYCTVQDRLQCEPSDQGRCGEYSGCDDRWSRRGGWLTLVRWCCSSLWESRGERWGSALRWPCRQR